MSNLTQKRHTTYAGNLNSETPGDTKKTFLQSGDLLASMALGFALQVSWTPSP